MSLAGVLVRQPLAKHSDRIVRATFRIQPRTGQQKNQILNAKMQRSRSTAKIYGIVPCSGR